MLLAVRKILTVLSLTFASSAQAANLYDCALADVTPLEYYMDLAVPDSMAGIRGSFSVWAECREQKMYRLLRGNQDLSGEMRLRLSMFGELRDLEHELWGTVTGSRMGSGFSMDYPLAKLADKTYEWAELNLWDEAQLSQEHFGESIAQSRQDIESYIEKIGSYRPTGEEMPYMFSQEEWDNLVRQYVSVVERTIINLGEEPNADTAFGYRLLADQIDW